MPTCMQDEMHDRAQLVRPGSAVLRSTGAPWQDILVVEQHRLPASRWHETAALPYLVGLALSAPGQLDGRAADGPGDRTCQPLAGRCMLSLNGAVLWRQAEEADVV